MSDMKATTLSHMHSVISGNPTTLMPSSNYLEQLLLSPLSIDLFLDILTTSDILQFRHLSAVLMRSTILNNYARFDVGMIEKLKGSLVRVLVREDDWLVMKGVCHAVISLAQFVLSDGNVQWDGFMETLYGMMESQFEGHQRAALFVLRVLTEENGNELRGEFDRLRVVFGGFIMGQVNPKIKVLALVGAVNMMQWLSVFTQIEEHASAIPAIIATIRDFVTNQNDDETISAFVALSDLAESPIPILNKHIDAVLSLSLEVAVAQSVTETVRVEALILLMWIVKHKHKSIGKGELLQAMIQVSMTCATEPEDNPYDFDDVSIHKYSLNLLEDLAKYISGDLTYSLCSQYFSEYMQSSDSNKHRAVLGALLKLCVVWESYLLDDLDLIIQYVKFGMSSSDPIVRMTACVAIGRLSDHLQPDISRYHSDIMPLIYNIISEEDLDIKEKALYSLVSFVEYLGENLIPYLDGLMAKLVELINIQNVEIQGMVLSALSAVVVSSKASFMQYLPTIMQICSELMSITDQETLVLKGRAIELVGNIALSIGNNFRPYVEFYMNAVLSTMTQAENAEIHEDCYGFIANLAEVLRGDIRAYLDTIVPLLLNACKIQYQDELSASAVVEEKRQAIHALSILSLALGGEFIPYMEAAMEVSLPLIDDRIESVRIAACKLSQSFIMVAQSCFPHPGGEPEPGIMGGDQPLSPEVQAIIDALFPIYIVMLKEDESCEVVTTVCEVMNAVLEKLGTSALDKYMVDIRESILALLMKTAVCNFPIEDDSSGDMQSEFYQIEEEELAVMIEVCALISTLARLYEHVFVEFFDIIETLDNQYLNPEVFLSYRYEASGCIAEVVELVGAPLESRVEYLYTIVKKGLSDSYKNIHNNAAYLAGVLCQNFPQHMSKYCQEILNAIHELFEEKEELMIRDNAASCVAKMMMSFPEVFPFTQVLPVFMGVLPLAVDMNENYSVYGALITLLQAQIPEISEYIPAILNLFTGLMGNNDIQQDIQDEMASTIQYLVSTYPNLQQTIAQFSDRQRNIIRQLMN